VRCSGSFRDQPPSILTVQSPKVWFDLGILGHKRVDVLANERLISGTLFQDQAGLTTVNTSDIHISAMTRLLTEWQERWNENEMGRYCYSIVPRVSIKAWMVSTVNDRAFLVAMSSLASNHTGTRAHLQRINVMQDAFSRCAMGYDTMGYGNVDYISH
jgi:hypothetical protein